MRYYNEPTEGQIMNSVIEQLIQAIQDATISVDVMVPDTDYYAQRGNSRQSSIDMVCPHKLIEALKGIDHVV